MKRILIIFVFLSALVIFNSVFRDTDTCKKDIKFKDFASEHLVTQNFLINNSTNHRLNHSAGNFLRIELIFYDDYSKYDIIVNNPSHKISVYEYEINYNHKNFSQINIFLPVFTQSQKSIKSEFLLI